MKNKNIISYLIIANLTVILLYILGKFEIIDNFIEVFILVIFTPIIFGVFLFYILKPLNDAFIKRGMKTSTSSTLTLIIFTIVIAIVIMYFGRYFMRQLIIIRSFIDSIVKNNDFIEFTQNSMANENVKSFITSFSNKFMGYINIIFANIKDIFNKGIMIFSNIILVVLITFFLLRDGWKTKPLVLKVTPNKYKEIVSNILSEGNRVLSTYIIGQAIVALSLSIMVFIGYNIIKIPGALLLAFTTFILAFIPFVGFFISMIIPYMVAIVMGFNMIIKLTILFVIAQTLKGRVVVPLIMGRAMKIHPITDIFLVVGSAAIGGPILAFCIVPIYSLMKVVYKNLREKGYISYNKFIKNKKSMTN